MSQNKLEYNMFQIGDTLFDTDGQSYTITGLLGHGGQGEAYKVVGIHGSYAVKWYYPNAYLSKINADAFRRNLERNVKNGIPRLSSGASADQFIWPLKMMQGRQGSFGYLMNLFPSGYAPLRDIIFGRVKWNSWFTRVTAALNIVRAFEILHARGLSYQDVNAGGFAVNPKTGSVFICDCDNVSPDKTNLGILGVKDFMAPEVVRGEKLPDHDTDEYSLAVILFRMFLHGHPMIGRESHSLRQDESRSDRETDNTIYGIRPHYCLDQNSPINMPDPQKDRDVLQMCMIYPLELMDAFEQVFTKGVNDPTARLTATEWRNVLIRVRDRIIIDNGTEQFFHCRREKPLPENCRILRCSNGAEIMCVPGKILYNCHFNPYSGDFSTQAGAIIPTNRPDVIGLSNQSGKDISVLYQGSQGQCLNGHKIPLFPGMKMQIGTFKIDVL